MRLCRDQNLAAEMAAFLFRRKLIFKMHTRYASLDIGFHDFKTVQRPAEPGFCISDNWNEPVTVCAAFTVFDLIGTLQGTVDLARQFRSGIGRVEALVGIHRTGHIGIGCNLPARQVNRLQSGAGHLHRLIAGHGAKGIDIIFRSQQLPQFAGSPVGQSMLDLHRSTQLRHILSAVRPFDILKAILSCVGDQGAECVLCHYLRSLSRFAAFYRSAFRFLLRRERVCLCSAAGTEI